MSEDRVTFVMNAKDNATATIKKLNGELKTMGGALDHLVYQLALLNVPNRSGTQFPLAHGLASAVRCG